MRETQRSTVPIGGFDNISRRLELNFIRLGRFKLEKTKLEINIVVTVSL